MEVESGVTIKVLVLTPKSLSGSDNVCFFYGQGAMGIALTPWSLKMAYNYMTVALNVVMVIPEYRKAPEHK